MLPSACHHVLEEVSEETPCRHAASFTVLTTFGIIVRLEIRFDCKKDRLIEVAMGHIPLFIKRFKSGHHSELRYGWWLHSTFSKILDGSS